MTRRSTETGMDDVIGYYIVKYCGWSIYGYGAYIDVALTAEEAVAGVWGLWTELQELEAANRLGLREVAHD